MPEGAVYVGRGTQWGNPFKVHAAIVGTSRGLTRDQAVVQYRHEIVQRSGGVLGFNRFWVASHLRGKDLACWCPLDQPCHADVLLELANTPDAGEQRPTAHRRGALALDPPAQRHAKRATRGKTSSSSPHK